MPYKGKVTPNAKVLDKTFPVLPAGAPDKLSRLIGQMLRFEAEKRPSAAEVDFIISMFLKNTTLLIQIEKMWRDRKSIQGDFEYKTFEQADECEKDKPWLDIVFDIDQLHSSQAKVDLELSLEDFKYDAKAMKVEKIADAHWLKIFIICFF